MGWTRKAKTRKGGDQRLNGSWPQKRSKDLQMLEEDRQLIGVKGATRAWEEVEVVYGVDGADKPRSRPG